METFVSNRGAIPEFGDRKPGQSYSPRPSAYAVIADADGRVAVMLTPRGCFLPGGGSEGRETPDETLVREVREECGLGVHIIHPLGESVEYVYTAGHPVGIRKECVFFAATVGKPCGAATEADHVLVWLEPQEAEVRLTHGSQQWAVRRFHQDGQISAEGKATMEEDEQT
jgi:8-oxo-dGTP diphosphatase